MKTFCILYIDIFAVLYYYNGNINLIFVGILKWLKERF